MTIIVYTPYLLGIFVSILVRTNDDRYSYHTALFRVVVTKLNLTFRLSYSMMSIPLPYTEQYTIPVLFIIRVLVLPDKKSLPVGQHMQPAREHPEHLYRLLAVTAPRTYHHTSPHLQKQRIIGTNITWYFVLRSIHVPEYIAKYVRSICILSLIIERTSPPTAFVPAHASLCLCLRKIL